MTARHCVAVAVAGLIAFSGSALLAQEAKAKEKKADKPAAAPKTELEKKVESSVQSLNARFALTDQQKSGLPALIKTQIEEESAWAQKNADKIKSLDEQLAKLGAERKQLDVDREQLRASQRRAVEAILTQDQKLAAAVNDLLRSESRYVAILDDTGKAKVGESAKAAATGIMAITETDARKRRDAEAAIVAKMRADVGSVVTVDVRRKGDMAGLSDGIARSLRNVKLDAGQQEKVNALCAAVVDQRLALAAEQAALAKKSDEIRAKLQARPEADLQKQVMEQILTAEQKEAMQGKPKPKAAAQPAAR